MDKVIEVLRMLADGVHGPQVHALIDGIEAFARAEETAPEAAPVAPAAVVPSLPAGAVVAPGKEK